MADNRGYVVIFVGVLTCAICSLAALRRKHLIQTSKRWPSTQGRILESTILEGKSATLWVRYQFNASDRPVLGNTPRISGDQFRNEKEMRAFVKRFPAGKQIEVFYNPTNPTESCLDRNDVSGLRTLWTLAFLGLVMAAGMAISMLFQV